MSETVIGAIIGALAALLGACIAAPITSWLEGKRFMREQRALAYEAAQRVIYSSGLTEPPYDFKEHVQLIESAAVKMALYATPRATTLFTEIIQMNPCCSTNDELTKQKISDKFAELQDQMRIDLKNKIK